MHISEIQHFYAGTHIFITGGTGFVGKILIEKLLRSTKVTKIYLLIREKKNKSIDHRLNELFEEIIYQGIKNKNPDYRKRIMGISGDCSLPGFGLSDSDKQILIENVNVVFHIAATIKFTEKLRLAYAINVKGAMTCLDLCKQIKNLRSYAYVSTAYTNCIFKKIEEKFYHYSVNYEDVEKLIEQLNDEQINKHLPKILGDWPNTYVFTKALAESYIRDNKEGVPTCIFRPGIITSSYEEPIEGWTDNYNGPIMASFKIITGELRAMHCVKDSLCDIVPVDWCVSALMACAWDVANKKREGSLEKTTIYNYVSSPENPITWGEYFTLNTLIGVNYQFLKHSWFVTYTSIGSKVVANLSKIFYHFLPAFIFDLCSVLCCKKPSQINMYSRLHVYQESVTYFCTKDWIFTNTNMVKLWEEMNQADRNLFPFSIKRLNWLAYIKTYMKGLKLYLMKEPLSTVKDAKKKQYRFKMIYYSFKLIFYYTLAVLVHNLFTKIYNLIC